MKLGTLASKVVASLAMLGGCREDPPKVVPLWANGAPGSEARRHEPELAKDWWVANVHDPSLTVVTPKAGKASGTAVVIVPGGGHERLVFGPEGLEPARYLARLGVAAFALKYRLARERGSSYSVEEHAFSDVARAIRWVRSRADTYGIDGKRVGIMGWSAGGELASLVSYRDVAGDPTAKDPIDRLSARPSFQIVIYPGSLGVPEQLPRDAPPAFFVAASDDKPAARTIARLLELYQKAEISSEVHLYAAGGHAFNMGARSQVAGIRHWPERLSEWLEARGLLD